MKPVKVILLFLFLTPIVFAQKPAVNPYASTDRKALQLPDSLTRTTTGIAQYITENFKADKDKARAIFIWVASNITYDAANMLAINFYETREEKIAKPLRTRKGICENYAALFNDLCQKTGIKSYVIEGYTKQNGFVEYIPHAWCAAQVDGSWFMYDPTWGSGFISGGKFYRKINNRYYQTLPSALIKSHMPFDYLWQFLNYPVTNQEFYEDRTQQNKSKPFFGYQDSIQAYDMLGHTEQLKSAAERIERNGVKNSLIVDRLQHLKLEIENIRQTAKVNLYNSAVSDYNAGINSFNEFINYRNRQFTPVKTDTEIQHIITLAESKLASARTKLTEVKDLDANLNASSAQLTKAIEEIGVHVKEQQDWLQAYFKKGKLGRRAMFYGKITWFGIPLNN